MERSTWTDERLDDMVARTESSFDLLRAEMADMRTEMRQGFADISTRVDGVRRDMFHGVIAIFGSLVAMFGALLAHSL